MRCSARPCSFAARTSASSTRSTASCFHTAATRGLPPAYDEYRRSHALTYGPGTAPVRLLRGEPVVELVDLLEFGRLSRGRAQSARTGRSRRRTQPACRSARQGRPRRRQRHDLSAGEAALFGKADYAAEAVCSPGRHRHREHAAASRAARKHRGPARVAAATDRDRRRAQGDQPLGVRSAGRARHARGIGGAALRRGHGCHHPTNRDDYYRAGSYGFPPRIRGTMSGATPVQARATHDHRKDPARGRHRPRPRCARRSRL